MYIFVCNTGSDPSTPQQSDSNCPGDVEDNIGEVGDLVPSSDSNNDGSVGIVGAESPQFIIEEELKFANRFEEGYDLFDPRYEEWLKCSHPESAGKATMTSPSILLSISTPSGLSMSAPSCGVPPSTSIPSGGVPPSTSAPSGGVPPSTSTPSGGVPLSTSTPSGGVPLSMSTPSGGVPPSTSSPSGGVPPSMSTPISSSVSRSSLSSSVASTSAPARSTKRSPFSDLLNILFVSTPVLPKTGKARVLTSSECLRLMKEKEEKKIQFAYEKEKRKQEREQKKKEKEEEQKKKATERAHKAEEKEADKARKEQEKAERAKMKARVEQENTVKAGKKRSLTTNVRGNSSRQK